MSVVLNAETRDFLIDRFRDFLLRCLDLCTALLRRADDVEGAPGEHAGDRVEVRRVNIAAEPCRLEGDRSAATEGVRHLRLMSETRDAQLLDELGQVPCRCAEMAIDLWPDRLK